MSRALVLGPGDVMRLVFGGDGMQVTILLGLAAVAAWALEGPESRKPEPRPTVVFVCEHGNVKSVIAREWFNRLAATRGLEVRAVSRGVTPEASVPPAIADALRRDGFDVTGFEARAFSAGEAKGAVRVVGIGVDLSSGREPGAAPLDTWEGIPPASERYAASRDALRARIETLLKALESEARRP